MCAGIAEYSDLRQATDKYHKLVKGQRCKRNTQSKRTVYMKSSSEIERWLMETDEVKWCDHEGWRKGGGRRNSSTHTEIDTPHSSRWVGKSLTWDSQPFFYAIFRVFFGSFLFSLFRQIRKKESKDLFLREEEEEEEEELLVMTAEKVKMREEGRKEGKRERAKDTGQKKVDYWRTSLFFFFSLFSLPFFFFEFCRWIFFSFWKIQGWYVTLVYLR